MIGPFASSFEFVLFIFSFILWCLSLVIERFFVKKESNKNVKSKEDHGTYLLIYISIFVSIIISFNLSINEIYLLPDIVFFIGIVFIIMGIFLREFSVITLGKYFSFQITIKQDHKIIESGPYHYIRHPSYSGGMLAIIGISLALRSSVAVLIVIVMSILVYNLRINFEEKLLVHEFGDQYIDYKKRTKKLIPFVY